MNHRTKPSGKQKRPIRWGRVLGLSLWLTMIGTGLLAYFVGRHWVGQYIRIQAQDLLKKDLGQEVLIGNAGIDLIRRQLWFENLRWHTPGPRGKTVFARIDRIELLFDYPPLLRREIHIRRVRILYPRLQVSYDAQARANWPVIHIQSRGPAVVRLAVDRIDVKGLSFFLKHDGIPLLLGLTDVDVRLIPHPTAGHLAGGLRIGQGFLQMYAYNPWQFRGGIQTRLTLDGPWIDQLHIYGKNFSVWGTGRIRGYGHPQIDLTLMTQVDNRTVRAIHNIDFRLEGRSRGIVHYDGDFSIFTMIGWVHSIPYRMGRLIFDDVVSPVYMTQNHLVLAGMKGRLTGGTVTGDFKIDPLFGISRYTLNLAGQRLDADRFGRMWGLRLIRHGAVWSGGIGINWRERAFPHLTGWTTVRAIATSPPAPRVTATDPRGTAYLNDYGYPVDLDFIGEIDGFRFRHAVARGTIGYIRGTVEGRIDFDGGIDVQADLKTSSIAEADMYYHQWLWNLVPEERDRIEFWEMDGRGVFTGKASFRVQDIALDGHFSGQNIRYFDVVWGDIETDVHYWHKIFAFQNSIVTDGPYRMESDEAYLYLGEVDFTIDGDAYADIRFLGYPVERVLAPTPLQFIPIRGDLRGILTVRGNYQQVDLWGDLNLTGGTFGTIPLDFGILRFSYVNFLLQIDEGLIAYKGGTMKFNGRWHRLNERFDDFQLNIQALPIGKLPWLQPYEMTGTLDLSATLNGSYKKPHMNVHGHLTEITLRQDPLGDVIIRNLKKGVGFDFRFLQDVGVTARANLIWDLVNRSFAGNFHADRMRIPVPSDVYFSGEGQFAGHLTPEYNVQMQMTLARGAFDIRGYLAQLQSKTTWVYKNQRIQIPETRWLFDRAPLIFDGIVHITPEGLKPDLNIRGHLNLDLISRLYPGIQTTGRAELQLRLSYVKRRPRLDGTISITNAALRMSQWPIGLQNLMMKLDIVGDRWNFETIQTRLGGGLLEGRGQMVWSAGKPEPDFFNFQFTGQDVRFPLRNVGFIRFSGSGSFVGIGQHVNLTADLAIEEGALDWEWTGLGRIRFMSREPFTPPAVTRETYPWLSRINLNIRTRVTNPIPITATFGSLALASQITWNLRTLGTLDHPSVIGVVNVHGGQLNLLNRLFNITDGQIRLVSPVEFRPVVRFQAETQIQSYLIRLRITGPLASPRVNLTSDPALPPSTILNLLGGQLYEPGQTREEATGFYTSLGSNFLLTLLAQPITSPAQRVLGIDRFSLDFSQLGPEAQPTPRLTLGKSISDRLNVTYSVGLSAIQNQIWLIEYSLNEAFRLLVTRDEEGFWGIDLFWRP